MKKVRTLLKIMKKVERLLKGRNCIAFVDFEGTQFSHEMIAIGAVLCTLDKKGQVKAYKEPFKMYVRAKNKIGNYVTDLTQITEELLKKEGKSFYDALMAFKKYLGTKWKKCLFVTYGNHDLRILNQSIAYNFQFPKDFCQQFQHNYADFAAFISEFIRDEKGNPLSLIHNCELFGVELMEPAHDPRSDAVNLARLYDAFVRNVDIVKEQFKRAVLHTNHLPDPISRVIQKLNNGESISPEEYDLFVKDYLK